MPEMPSIVYRPILLVKQLIIYRFCELGVKKSKSKEILFFVFYVNFSSSN